jgi:hypothetical protein
MASGDGFAPRGVWLRNGAQRLEHFVCVGQAFVGAMYLPFVIASARWRAEAI